MAFENSALMRIFGPKKEDVSAGWRRLHNEELHKSYASANIIRVINSRKLSWPDRACSMHEEDET
jgi:hypothetical protein